MARLSYFGGADADDEVKPPPSKMSGWAAAAAGQGIKYRQSSPSSVTRQFFILRLRRVPFRSMSPWRDWSGDPLPYRDLHEGPAVRWPCNSQTGEEAVALLPRRCHRRELSRREARGGEGEE